jgi:hypothetical protein
MDILALGSYRVDPSRIKSRVARAVIKLEKFEENLRAGAGWSRPIRFVARFLVSQVGMLLLLRWWAISKKCPHNNITSAEESGWNSLCLDCGRWSS